MVPSLDVRHMRFPLSTGQSASLLDSTEPKLAELVRSGKVHPPPLVFAGRRLWERRHLMQAAEALGALDDELRARLGEEVPT